MSNPAEPCKRAAEPYWGADSPVAPFAPHDAWSKFTACSGRSVSPAYWLSVMMAYVYSGAWNKPRSDNVVAQTGKP